MSHHDCWTACLSAPQTHADAADMQPPPPPLPPTTSPGRPIDLALPGHLPARLTGPLTELGPDHPDAVARVCLSDDEVRCVEEALAGFKALEMDGQTISRDNFLLPAALQAKLRGVALAVHQGGGVSVVRGLDPARYSVEDNLLLFLGLSSFIGDKHGIQDKKGNVITHVTDAKGWSVPYEKRHGVHTTQSLTWHSDMGADVLALQVRQVAAHGGALLLASSWRIYNELAATCPDVLCALAEADWPVHVSDRKSRYVLAPLLAMEAGRLLLSFDPSRLGAHPAMAGGRSSRRAAIPALTATQREALGVVAAVAEKHAVTLGTVPGDLVFINNWAVIHSRSAYVDAAGGDAAPAAAGARRHLLRLWLRSSELGWTVPESLRAPWEAAFGYTDEGYVSGDHGVLAAQLQYAVVPPSTYKPPRYACGSAAFAIEESDSEGSGSEGSGSEGEGEVRMD